MGVMLSWLGKKLELSITKVNPMEGATASRGLQADKTTDTDGNSTQNLRGYDPRKFSCSSRITATMGFPDVLGEYESWEALVGMYAPIYLGSTQYADSPFLLKEVSVNDIMIDDRTGKWLTCVIKLDFEERVDNKSSAKGSVTDVSLSKAVGISDKAAARNKSAAAITASAYDKRTRGR